jgi:hypothetical protein
VASLLKALLPSQVDDDQSLQLFKDLCSVASAIVRSSGDGTAGILGILGFISEVLFVHGYTIEASIPSESATALAREIARHVQELFLQTIGSAKNLLGSEWNRPPEQLQGQAPIETKQPTILRQQSGPSDISIAVFQAVCRGLERCPLFMSVLPSGFEHRAGSDLMLRRVVNSALGALNDRTPEVTMQAMEVFSITVRTKTRSLLSLPHVSIALTHKSFRSTF